MIEILFISGLFIGIVLSSILIMRSIEWVEEVYGPEISLRRRILKDFFIAFPKEKEISRKSWWLSDRSWIPSTLRNKLILITYYISEKTLSMTLAIFLLAGLLSIWMLAGSIFAALIMGTGFLGVIWLGISMYADFLRKKISTQVPSLLSSVSNSLKAGYSLQQAFQFVARELAQPLRNFVMEATERISLGQSLQESLTQMKQQVSNMDLDFVVDATLIQVKKGGDLTKIFQKISHSIHERIRLEKDLKSAVSQGKLSGFIIAGLWPAALALFSIMSPSYIAPLFSTSLGQALLGTAIGLEIIGFLIIYRITKLPL